MRRSRPARWHAVCLLVIVAAAAAVVVWTVVGAASGASTESSGHEAVDTGRIVLLSGSRQLVVLRTADYRGSGGPRRLARAVRAAVPAHAVVRRGRASVALRYLEQSAVRDALSTLGHGGGEVVVRRAPIASVIDVPVIAQSMRNNCESAALSILLAGLGVKADQDRLQRSFPRSGPLDPQGTGSERVWGDPDAGYVGRPDGGGVAGGFGIYPRPLIGVAARLGAKLTDLTGRSVAAVYRHVLAGHPVMVWVGLSDGPYGSWRSPSGRRITVNFGEHTVVLSGANRDGSFRVTNPLEGTREEWTRERFSTMWRRLGRRALGPA